MKARACSILSRVSIRGFNTAFLMSFCGTDEVKKLTDITAAGNHIRFAPVELPESRQVRVQRLYPKTVLKPTVRTMLVPAPKTAPIGGQPLRDTELLAWCGEIIRSVLADLPVGVGLRLPGRAEQREIGGQVHRGHHSDPGAAGTSSTGADAVVSGAGANPSPARTRWTQTAATLNSGCLETGSHAVRVSSLAAVPAEPP